MDGSELAGLDLFSGVPEEERDRLAAAMRAEEHRMGEVLVEQGDLPMKFFLLLEGNVTVHRDGRHVADLGPSDFFGETGVLSLGARNASVIATTPIRVAVAMGWELRDLLADASDLRTRLEAAASARRPPT